MLAGYFTEIQTMKKLMNRVIIGLGLSVTILLTTHAYAQYPGGMGGGGMGGRMGGMNNPGMMGNSSPRPQSLPFASMANQQTEWMKNNLSLSKDQVKAVRKLNNTYAEKQKTETQGLLPAGGAAPSDATRQQIREVMSMLNEEKEEELKPILTPEQWTTYRAKRDSITKVQDGNRPTIQGRPR